MIPTVIFIIDESGSMNTDFPSGSGISRWDALRGSLLAPGGLIETFQQTISFGLVQRLQLDSRTPPSYDTYPPQPSKMPISMNTRTSMSISTTAEGPRKADRTFWPFWCLSTGPT